MRYVDAILGTFAGRRTDTRDFALRYRVVLVHASNGVGIDISLGAIPFEERAVERATGFQIAEGAWITTCSAEDLVVLKAFAGRTRDWADIEGIAIRQAGTLDEARIRAELVPLLELKGSPEDADRLMRILRQAHPPR